MARYVCCLLAIVLIGNPLFSQVKPPVSCKIYSSDKYDIDSYMAWISIPDYGNSDLLDRYLSEYKEGNAAGYALSARLNVIEINNKSYKDKRDAYYIFLNKYPDRVASEIGRYQLFKVIVANMKLNPEEKSFDDMRQYIRSFPNSTYAPTMQILLEKELLARLSSIKDSDEALKNAYAFMVEFPNTAFDSYVYGYFKEHFGKVIKANFTGVIRKVGNNNQNDNLANLEVNKWGRRIITFAEDLVKVEQGDKKVDRRLAEFHNRLSDIIADELFNVWKESHDATAIKNAQIERSKSGIIIRLIQEVKEDQRRYYELTRDIIVIESINIRSELKKVESNLKQHIDVSNEAMRVYLQSQFDTVNKNIADVRKDVAELRAVVNTIAADVGEIKSKLKTMDEKIDGLHKKMDDSLESLKCLHREVEKMNDSGGFQGLSAGASIGVNIPGIGPVGVSTGFGIGGGGKGNLFNYGNIANGSLPSLGVGTSNVSVQVGGSSISVPSFP